MDLWDGTRTHRADVPGPGRVAGKAGRWGLGGLLHNARKFFQGLAPAPTPGVQRFSVACPEGHRLSGVRTEGYQSLRCPTCGEGMFVLPRSVLPEPAAPAARREPSPRLEPIAGLPVDDGPVMLTDPPAPTQDEVDGEVVWDDDPGEVPTLTPVGPRRSPEDFAQDEIRHGQAAPAAVAASAPKATGVRAGSGVAKGRGRKEDRARRGAGRSPGVVVVPRATLADRLHRHRNALIAGLVVLSVAGTVAIRTWRSRRQELPRIAERGRVEGLPALDNGKFDLAYQLLSEARRAVVALGDAYQGSAAIKQGADEAVIINQLIPESLEALLDEAARTEPKAWSKTFDTLYKGRSVIVDAHIVSAPDGSGEGRYELDYRVFREGGDGNTPRSVGRVDTTGFRLFELTRPRVGDRVTFGARLASFRFDPDREQWLAGLEPDSGVIMTHMKALEALGWPSASDTETAAESGS